MISLYQYQPPYHGSLRTAGTNQRQAARAAVARCSTQLQVEHPPPPPRAAGPRRKVPVAPLPEPEHWQAVAARTGTGRERTVEAGWGLSCACGFPSCQCAFPSVAGFSLSGPQVQASSFQPEDDPSDFKLRPDSDLRCQ